MQFVFEECRIQYRNESIGICGMHDQQRRNHICKIVEHSGMRDLLL